MHFLTTVFISDYSTVHPKELGFERTNSYDHKFINVIINEISLDTQVNARGVDNMRDTRLITVGNDEVEIREGFLSDDTGSHKIDIVARVWDNIRFWMYF